jgi:hypothetical protein
VHLNSKFVKVGLLAVAPMMLVSAVVLTSGVASAKGKKPPAQTITCNGLTATITFTPPLVPTASSPGFSKTDTTTISGETLTSCTENPAGAVTAASSASATIPPSKKGNTCSAFAASAAKSKFTFTTNWNNGGGTSTAKFKGAAVSSAPPGFVLSKGKVTGAFPSKTGSVHANLDSASTAAFAACEGGSGNISTLTINAGSFSTAP